MNSVQDMVWGPIVISGVPWLILGALASRAWSHFSTKSIGAELEHLKARLALMQQVNSPRLVAALALWRAYLAFEQSLCDLQSPGAVEGVERSGPALRVAINNHRKFVVSKYFPAAQAARAELIKALADAECLFPRSTFDALRAGFDDLQRCFETWGLLSIDLIDFGESDPLKAAYSWFERALAKHAGVLDAIRNAVGVDVDAANH